LNSYIVSASVEVVPECYYAIKLINAYPSGAPDFTSGFHRGSCCPVICVSLFHVI